MGWAKEEEKPHSWTEVRSLPGGGGREGGEVERGPSLTYREPAVGEGGVEPDQGCHRDSSPNNRKAKPFHALLDSVGSCQNTVSC